MIPEEEKSEGNDRYEEEVDNELAFKNTLKWNKHKKPLSWSAISSFGYNKEQWYRSYVLGIKDPPSKEMEFGSYIGKRLETEPDFMPEVERCITGMEYKLHVTFGDIELIGFCDSFDINNFILYEFKTSSNKNKWTQESVDSHGQIDMYLLMLYIKHNIRPEEVKEINLFYIPVKENGGFEMEVDASMQIQRFKTKRTTKDIIKFGVLINQTIKEMEAYE